MKWSLRHMQFCKDLKDGQFIIEKNFQGVVSYQLKRLRCDGQAEKWRRGRESWAHEKVSELSENHSVVSDSLWLHGLHSHGILQARILEWVAFPFSRRSSQLQESNSGLLHSRRILYQLSHEGSPRILERVAYPFSSGSSQPRNRTRVSCIAGWFFTNWAIREAWSREKSTCQLLVSSLSPGEWGC